MKTKKTTKSKAVVGSAKKKKDSLFSRKNWQKKLFVGSASLLLILSVGFTGVNYWQDKQLKAQAAGLKIVYQTQSGVIFRACKYGYQVRGHITNRSGSTIRITNGAAITNGSIRLFTYRNAGGNNFYVDLNGRTVSTQSTAYLPTC